MRQPGHFLFGNSELAHAFQWVWCCPFTEPGQLTKDAAQIALFQVDSYRAGSVSTPVCTIWIVIFFAKEFLRNQTANLRPQ
jgi:hypothetical protein